MLSVPIKEIHCIILNQWKNFNNVTSSIKYLIPDSYLILPIVLNTSLLISDYIIIKFT